MSSVRKTGGGAFDPSDRWVYFIASNVERMKFGSQAHDHILVAVNEVNTPRDEEIVEGWIDSGKRVFLDSGIFWLTNEHARANNVSMDIALGLAPDEIDNFDWLWNRYTKLVTRWGDRLWGYIELDQGGRANKVKTRARLEGLGFAPVPVYHPLNDGWEYFDELAQQYDRICFGNVVQADAATRKRLVATAWERHRRYPHLWIHLLGYTPNEVLYAMPINSGDSSTWLSSVRWSGYKEVAHGRGFSELPRGFQYQLGSDRDAEVGSRKATKMAALGAAMAERNWRHAMGRFAELGFEPYPEVTTHE